VTIAQQEKAMTALAETTHKLPTPALPWLLVLVGFMGCGKTTVGRILAQRWRVDFIDLDQEISQLVGMPVAAIFAEYGEAQFRQWEQETLQAVLARYPRARNPLLNKKFATCSTNDSDSRCVPTTITSSAVLAPAAGLTSPARTPRLPAPRAVLALGGGTWISASNRQLIQPQAISIWLDCSLAVSLTRLRADDSRPLAKDPSQLAALLAARWPSYQLADYHLEVTTLSPAKVAQIIRTYPLF
jgi:shikimate kinase